MRIVELPSEQTPASRRPRTGRVYKIKEPVYRGPPDSYHYSTLRALGVTQLTLGSLLTIVGLIQVTLSDEDRAVALVSGTVVIWMPLFAIAAGLVGVLFSRHRYWEVECTRLTFIILSSLAAVMMLAVILIVIFIQFYYYDVTNLKPDDTFKWLDKSDLDRSDNGSYQAMVIIMVVLAALEAIVAVVSAIAASLSPVYEPEKEAKPIRHKERPAPVEKPTSPSVPTSQIYTQPGPIQYIAEEIEIPIPSAQFAHQPVQYLSQQGPIQFINAAPLASPPPSLVYMM